LEVTPKNEGGRPPKRTLPERKGLVKPVKTYKEMGIDKKLAAQSAKMAEVLRGPKPDPSNDFAT
jgi:hypothetical protein